MGTRYIENTTAHAMYVGGKMIPPGEGRDIDEALLPKAAAEATDAPDSGNDSMEDALRELQAQTVAAIRAELPNLKAEALDRLEDLEKTSEHPRKGVMEAVQAERIRRAAHQLDGGPDEALQAVADALYQQQLDALSPEQLAALGETEHAQLREKALAEASLQP